MAKALLTDGLLSVFPAADACPADLCVVGKLLTVPAFCLPVSAEEGSAAPVQKQGVVVQNILHRDTVKGGELVGKFRREAAVKCAAFQIPIEPFLHAHHGNDLFLQQVKTIAAPTQTVPWVRDIGVRVGILFSIPKCAGERIANELRMHFRRERRNGVVISLQETLEAGKEDSALTLSDVLQDGFCMEDACERQDEARRLRRLIEGLPARERKLILLRYGLAGQPPLTQLETAQLLQISRSYVSRLETHALEQLRKGWLQESPGE